LKIRNREKVQRNLKVGVKKRRRKLKSCERKTAIKMQKNTSQKNSSSKSSLSKNVPSMKTEKSDESLLIFVEFLRRSHGC
jgi:hypothetical protein